jgi:hypothetical protein
MKRLVIPITQQNVTLTCILSALLVVLPMAVFGQKNSAPDPASLMAQQREAMAPLVFLNGIWRGPAWILLPSGKQITFTQTERIGPFLDGSIKVIDGRGYSSDGKLIFNAFGVLSYDSAQHSYSMHSYAQGHSGDFKFTPSANGYTWEIPAGPMTIRYTADVKNGVLHEVGTRILPSNDSFKFFEMNVRRVGDTDWPNAGAIGPQ